jgi:predicted anti-sigma-YlaC factor YlaD
LEQHVRGLLTKAELASVEEHLLLCEDCRNRLVLVEYDWTVMRAVLKEHTPEAARYVN